MLIAGNWKMNLKYEDILKLKDILTDFKLDNRVEMAIFPQSPLLRDVCAHRAQRGRTLHPLRDLHAQDVHRTAPRKAADAGRVELLQRLQCPGAYRQYTLRTHAPESGSTH